MTRAAPLEIAEGQRIGWYPVTNDAKENEVVTRKYNKCATVEIDGPDPRCKSCAVKIGVRALSGGRRLNQGNGRDRKGSEASQLECNNQT